MTRAERREVKNKKVARRLRLMGNLGMQAGILYARHREKVTHSGGYMSKGNVSHYVAVKQRRYYDRNKDDVYGILCDCEEDTEV